MANISLVSFPTPQQHGGHPLLSASLHVSRLHNFRSGHQRRRIQERTKPKHPIPSSEGRYQHFWFGENGCSMPCLPPSNPSTGVDKLFPLSLSLPAPQRDHCYACTHGRFTWVPMAHGAGLKQQLVSNSLDVHHSEDRSLDTATTEDFTQEGKSQLSSIRLSPNISQTSQSPQTGSMLNDDMKNFTSESLLASVTEPHGHVIYDFETYWTESELLEKSDSSSAWDQSNEKSAETLSLQLTSPPDIPIPTSHPFPSPTNSTQLPCHAISSSPRSTISQGNGTYRLKHTSQSQDTYTLDTQPDNINPTVGSFTSDNLLDISPGLQTTQPVSEPQVLEESMTEQEDHQYVREGQEMGLNEYRRVSIDPEEIPSEGSTGHISSLALQRKHKSQNVKPKAVVGDSPILNLPISIKAPGSKSFTNFPKRSAETVIDVTDQLPNRGNFWDVDIETLILEDEGGESLTDTEYDENQCSHSGVEHNVTNSHHKDSLGLEEPDLSTNSVTAWSDVTDPICHHNNPESGTQALNNHPYKSPKEYASDGYQSDILATRGYQSYRPKYTEVLSHSFESTGSRAHKPESGSDSDIEAVSLLHSSDFKDSAESLVKDPNNQVFPSSDMVKIKRKYLRECHVEGNIAKADTQDCDKAAEKPDLYFLHPDVVAERVIERYKIDASTALRMTERNDTFTQQYREKMAQRRLSLPSMKPRKLQPLIEPPHQIISPTRRHSHQPNALHLTERSLDLEETWFETPQGHDIP